MEFSNFSYLLITAVTLIIPLSLSFDTRVRFYTKIKYLVPAVLFSGAIFIVLDMRFEEQGIWRFNPKFVIGKNIFNLPVEEWLYFIAVPYSSVFIYEVLKTRLVNFERPNLFLSISLVLVVIFGILAYTTREKLYPFFSFFLLAIYLGYTVFRNRFKKHYTKFYMAYFAFLVPFVVIHLFLTSLPVIEYNPVHNLGIRFLTIPVENFVAMFLLFLINITIYEYLKEREIY